MANATIVGDRDLSVYDQFVPDAGEDRVERGAKPFGSVEAVAADQPQGAAPVQDRDQPVPIVLDLVQPPVADWRLSARCHECQVDAGRQASGICAGGDAYSPSVQLRVVSSHFVSRTIVGVAQYSRVSPVYLFH